MVSPATSRKNSPAGRTEVGREAKTGDGLMVIFHLDPKKTRLTWVFVPAQSLADIGLFYLKSV